MRRAFRLLIEFFSTPTAFAGECAAREETPPRRMGSRRRQRNVFSTVRGSRCGVPAVLASAALAALGCSTTASGVVSPRGLHVISTGGISPNEVVLADDATPWFTVGKDATSFGPTASLLIHVNADGRVVRYHLPKSSEPCCIAWGADGALWAVDEDIGGLIRVTPDGRYTRFRDVWATPETLNETYPRTSSPAQTADYGSATVRSIASSASLQTAPSASSQRSADAPSPRSSQPAPMTASGSGSGSAMGSDASFPTAVSKPSDTRTAKCPAQAWHLTATSGSCDRRWSTKYPLSAPIWYASIGEVV